VIDHRFVVIGEGRIFSDVRISVIDERAMVASESVIAVADRQTR
jgi:hypothetical protein